MRAYQEITERIRYVEGFEVIVSAGNCFAATPPYPFDRAASRKTLVSDWMMTRFKAAYPNFTGCVVRPDGTPLRDDVAIGIARDAYHDRNRGSYYGQSIVFEYSDDVETTILHVRRVLMDAGLSVEFDRSKFLWMQSFFVRGAIRNIHLPGFQCRELSAALESVAKTLKVDFRHHVENLGGNLYEKDSGYAYFGISEFERFKRLIV